MPPSGRSCATANMPKAPAQPAKRGRPSKSTQPTATKRKAPTQQQPRKKSGPFELSDSDSAPARTRANQEDKDDEGEENEEEVVEEEVEGPENTIPINLLHRLLHEFFEKDNTKMTKGANDAAGKYMDVFVREAIARCVHERHGGFLEVSFDACPRSRGWGDY